jgi:hypothetical protein
MIRQIYPSIVPPTARSLAAHDDVGAAAKIACEATMQTRCLTGNHSTCQAIEVKLLVPAGSHDSTLVR